MSFLESSNIIDNVFLISLICDPLWIIFFNKCILKSNEINEWFVLIFFKDPKVYSSFSEFDPNKLLELELRNEIVYLFIVHDCDVIFIGFSFLDEDVPWGKCKSLCRVKFWILYSVYLDWILVNNYFPYVLRVIKVQIPFYLLLAVA
jgi:hypothetical protein